MKTLAKAGLDSIQSRRIQSKRFGWSATSITFLKFMKIIILFTFQCFLATGLLVAGERIDELFDRRIELNEKYNEQFIQEAAESPYAKDFLPLEKELGQQWVDYLKYVKQHEDKKLKAYVIRVELLDEITACYLDLEHAETDSEKAALKREIKQWERDLETVDKFMGEHDAAVEPSLVSDADSDKAEVLKAAREVASGFLDGDWDIALANTDQRYFKEMGVTDEDMAAEIERTKAQFKQADLKFLKFNPMEPEKIYYLDSYTIAFVPSENAMTIGESTITGTSFLIGAKYKGESRWRLMDGSSMTREEILEFYSELPKDCEIPPVKMEVEK